MKLLCLGDSLTFGSNGYSYIPFLPAGLTPVNWGKNGDTTRCAFSRLGRYLRGKRGAGIDACAILVGINDLLAPHLATLSPIWRMVMQPRTLYKRCILQDADFAAEYDGLLAKLKERRMPTILVGLPFLEMEGFPLDRIEARNAILQQLAKKYGLPFVDLYALQQSARAGDARPYSWGRVGLVRVLDSLAMLLVPKSKDWFAKTRGLSLTVDGLHFNSRSARLLAEEVGKQALLLKAREATR